MQRPSLILVLILAVAPGCDEVDVERLQVCEAGPGTHTIVDDDERAWLAQRYTSHDFGLSLCLLEHESLSFPELESIEGTFKVTTNPMLVSLSAPRLREVRNRVFILHNPLLTTVDLSALESSEGLFLQDSPSLEAVPHLPAQADMVSLFCNDALTDVSSLAGVEIGALSVTGNENLDVLEIPGVAHLHRAQIGVGGCGQSRLSVRLPDLETVGEDGLDLRHDLTALHLPRLHTIEGGDLVFQINRDFTGPLELPTLEQARQIVVTGNALTALRLPSLRALSGGLYVGSEREPNYRCWNHGCGNPDLIEVWAPMLTAIGAIPAGETWRETFGQLVLTDQNLRSLDLSALETIRSSLIIRGTSLESLDGLSSLRRVGGDLVIKGNPLLPDCVVRTFALQVLNAGGVGGTITLQGNGPACD